MIKSLLKITLASVLLLGCPVYVSAVPSIEIIDNDFQDITISVQGSTLHITGANGETLHIYNVAGVKVQSIKVDGSDKHYDLNLTKGCYILKVGKVVRKISIR